MLKPIVTQSIALISIACPQTPLNPWLATPIAAVPIIAQCDVCTTRLNYSKYKSILMSQDQPPAGPYGSPARLAWWANYWNNWGGKKANVREASGVIHSLEQSVVTHQAELGRAQHYKALGIPGADLVINADNAAILALNQAIAQKRIEYSKEGITV